MYDPFELCKVEERSGKTWHVADPGVVIPATVARIQEALKSPWVNPEELVNPADSDPRIAAGNMLDQAKHLPAGALQAALNGKPGDPARAQALGVVWSWFKRSLALKVGAGVLLHITKNEVYKE